MSLPKWWMCDGSHWLLSGPCVCPHAHTRPLALTFVDLGESLGWEWTHLNAVGPILSRRQAATRFQMALAGRLDRVLGRLQSSWFVLTISAWLSTKKVRKGCLRVMG